jgi:hypothetical protein
MKEQEKDHNDSREAIVYYYRDYVRNEKKLPKLPDLQDYGASRDMVRRRFGGMKKLHDYMQSNHSDYLSQYISSIEDVFGEAKGAHKFEKKTLVITTAVADSEAHLGFMDALDTFCAENDAQVIVMPCESVTNSFEAKTASFDPIFNDPKYLFVQSDTAINNNLMLCSIQVSAKQIKPITGLQRVGRRDGSYVFASPKQFLEYVPSGNKRGKNYSIMTPGACTLPKYYSEVFVSKRLSYIAEHDHTMGAVIVEIEDDNIFHFRQIQCDESGTFIDFGREYSPDGTVKDVPVNVIMGDLHGVNCDMNSVSATIKALEPMNIKRLFLHDVFDAESVSHHVKDIGELYQRHASERDSLENELIATYTILEHLDKSLTPREVLIVKSNHDEHLDRYLREGRYVDDPVNHYTSLKVAPALFENVDVLKYAFEQVGMIPRSHWRYLSREDSVQVGGVECAAHGDLGMNGGGASLNGMEKVYGRCVIGHSHTPAIQRGVFRVGTLSKLDMGYNRGPSTWLPTSCLLYENGQMQLINVVNGKCRP